MRKGIIVLLATVLGCASMNVSYDFDRQADFTKYRTYQFTDESLSLPVGDLNRNRIISAVETELAAKGFTKSDQPDALVDVYITAKKEVDATATTTGTGPWRYGYGGGFSTTQVTYNEYIVGTLLISLIDYSVKQIVWQGTGTKTLDESASPEKRESNINYAVQQIFSNYPPKK